VKRKRKPDSVHPLPPELQGEIMTLLQVADFLGCHKGTIYRLLERKQIPAFRMGRDYRFRRPDIDKWIAAGGGVQGGDVVKRLQRRPRPKT
jgi:excisionase family DNA binding protein